MPGIKELHYFDEKIHEPKNVAVRLAKRVTGKRTVDRRWRRQVKARSRRHLKNFSKRDFLWDLKYYAGAPNDAWYGSLFERGRGKVVGEITPSYSMIDPEVVARVHAGAPDAKIIFMMRSPIERVWSQAVMAFGKTKGLSATDIPESKLGRNFESKGSRLRTDYLRTLENWSMFFPPERIFVGFLEDVSFFPEELLRSVYGFLGVDAAFEPPGFGDKVHSRTAGTAPAKALTHLARTYHDDMEALAERFGGYASFWLYCAERLIEDPPEEAEIPYPLWESAMWAEWEGSRNNVFRSGPLASLATRKE